MTELSNDEIRNLCFEIMGDAYNLQSTINLVINSALILFLNKEFDTPRAEIIRTLLNNEGMFDKRPK